jgi:hypothetical protein
MYLSGPSRLLSSSDRNPRSKPKGDTMKTRLYMLTAAACAATALVSPVAQAQLDGNWSYGAAVKSTASLKTYSKSTLAAMRAAGTSYHASAAKSQSAVRPDDRSGPRGV